MYYLFQDSVSIYPTVSIMISFPTLGKQSADDQQDGASSTTVNPTFSTPSSAPNVPESPRTRVQRQADAFQQRKPPDKSASKSTAAIGGSFNVLATDSSSETDAPAIQFGDVTTAAQRDSDDSSVDFLWTSAQSSASMETERLLQSIRKDYPTVAANQELTEALGTVGTFVNTVSQYRISKTEAEIRFDLRSDISECSRAAESASRSAQAATDAVRETQATVQEFTRNINATMEASARKSDDTLQALAAMMSTLSSSVTQQQSDIRVQEAATASLSDVVNNEVLPSISAIKSQLVDLSKQPGITLRSQRNRSSDAAFVMETLQQSALTPSEQFVTLRDVADYSERIKLNAIVPEKVYPFTEELLQIASRDRSFIHAGSYIKASVRSELFAMATEPTMLQPLLPFALATEYDILDLPHDKLVLLLLYSVMPPDPPQFAIEWRKGIRLCWPRQVLNDSQFSSNPTAVYSQIKAVLSSYFSNVKRLYRQLTGNCTVHTNAMPLTMEKDDGLFSSIIEAIPSAKHPLLADWIKRALKTVPSTVKDAGKTRPCSDNEAVLQEFFALIYQFFVKMTPSVNVVNSLVKPDNDNLGLSVADAAKPPFRRGSGSAPRMNLVDADLEDTADEIDADVDDRNLDLLENEVNAVTGARKPPGGYIPDKIAKHMPPGVLKVPAAAHAGTHPSPLHSQDPRACWNFMIGSCPHGSDCSKGSHNMSVCQARLTVLLQQLLNSHCMTPQLLQQAETIIRERRHSTVRYLESLSQQLQPPSDEPSSDPLQQSVQQVVPLAPFAVQRSDPPTASSAAAQFPHLTNPFMGYVAVDPQPTLAVLQSIFATRGLDVSKMPSNAFDGKITLPNGKDVPVLRAVGDSGCFPFSVISSKLVDIVLSTDPSMSAKFVKRDGTARLADSTTTVRTHGFIALPISFDYKGRTHSSEINFSVMDMPQGSVLIGLYDICLAFFDMFVEFLEDVRYNLRGAIADLERPPAEPPPIAPLNVSSSVIDEPAFDVRHDSIYSPHLHCHLPSFDVNTYCAVNNLRSPWTQPLEEMSPEEEATSLPSAFGGPLQYLTKPHDEALADYYSMFEEHVSPALRQQHPEFLELLRSPLCLQVFVPPTWTGLKIPPIALEFKDTFPEVHRPPRRHFNPALLKFVEPELERLTKYFLEPSTSTTVSPMVLAPKATPPYVRFCIDLRDMNIHIKNSFEYIPDVQEELQKCANFLLFFDLDMKNSFHQLPIDARSRAALAVQTPLGQFQPRFLPEGVGPASGILQRVVREIFSECRDWIIVLFDNFLICAHDFADGIAKFKRVIEIAASYNMVLSFPKSWLGFDKVSFFGYEVSHGRYTLSEARKAGVTSIPFPSSVLEMQRALGSGMYFAPFLPNYSALTAPLNDMVHRNFNWDPSTWAKDYRGAWDRFLKAIGECQYKYFPDYSKPWRIQADASEDAVGAVLLQDVADPSDPTKVVQQVIAFASKKFSAQAFRWDMYKKEAFALYFAIKSFAYYLHGGKSFILETDHRNLLWIEQSEAAIVIRWRIYMQGFNFLLRHIPGKSNVIADWQSRMWNSSSVPYNAVAFLIAAAELEQGTPEYYLSRVHGGRQLHFGARRTWEKLNESFPGHKVPFSFVAEWVSNCPTCQKTRLGMTGTLEPIPRHLKVPHARARIGVDRLSISPEDRNGFNNLIVIHEAFTSYVKLFASKDYTAISLATALFQYYCEHGIFEQLISDPGSDLMSEVVRYLNSWFGIEHLVSLVDRHQSNTTERSNQEVLRHLRSIVFDERVKDRWADPTVLCIAEFAINSSVNSETGVTPFEAKFGSHARTYFRLPADLPESARASEFLRLLDSDLRHIHGIIAKTQRDIIRKRVGTHDLRKQNMFQPGDFVLHWQQGPDKLTWNWYGPLEVVRQYKNDVQARHLATGALGEYHVERLKLFVGSPEVARDTAMRDADQFLVSAVVSHQGNPLKRSETRYLVRFADGSESWKHYSPDISTTAAFVDYCSSRPELRILLIPTAQAAKQFYSRVVKLSIPSLVNLDPRGELPFFPDRPDVHPGVQAFVDLRFWSDDGHNWYFSLPLPDVITRVYVVPITYDSWVPGSQQRKISLYCPLFDESYVWNSYEVLAYGSRLFFDSARMTLVDERLALAYPTILPSGTRKSLLRRFKNSL